MKCSNDFPAPPATLKAKSALSPSLLCLPVRNPFRTPRRPVVAVSPWIAYAYYFPSVSFEPSTITDSSRGGEGVSLQSLRSHEYFERRVTVTNNYLSDDSKPHIPSATSSKHSSSLAHFVVSVVLSLPPTEIMLPLVSTSKSPPPSTDPSDSTPLH